MLSGVAGLIYQTAWARQLAFVFGTSELAIVTVLAAYMAGLALGAALAGRYEQRVRRPVRAYALLELGIGLTALAVPAMVDLAGRLHVALMGGGEIPPEASAGSALFSLTSSFLILLIPTALMGATLPLLARHAVRRDAELGRRVGVLYSANAGGAALGALLSAFVLLPTLGLGRTTLVAVALNGVVFLLAVLLARAAAPLAGTEPEAAREGPSSPGLEAGLWVLPAVLVSGAVSFTHEVVWTRLFAQLIGGSVYAFAVMLATFLCGIALGSAVASRRAASPERARRGFALAQLAVAAAGVAGLVAFDRLAPLVGGPAGRDEWALLKGGLLCAGVLLPVTVAIGATFPLAVRILARDAGSAARASARVLAWNTVGAITGALLAGYLVLPALRFAGTVGASAAASLVLAAWAALAGRPRHGRVAALAGAGLVGLWLISIPTPWNVLRHSPLSGHRARGDVAYYAVGRSATVLLVEEPLAWRLTTNGLPESAIARPGARVGRVEVSRWLSLLPLAARPDTSSMLVVGLGAGLTVEEVPSALEEIHVVELEPEVIRANRHMAGRRRADPLDDPRIRLHIDDARSALRLTGRRFDAIVSQPSHPWTAGASHLFTREFFTLVRDRLTPEGVFVQWMGLPFVDEGLLRSLVATAVDVFAHVEVYQPRAGAVLLLASPAPLDTVARAGAGLEAAPREWARLGVLSREGVLAARALDDEGARRWARGAAVSTDSHNLLQTGSPRALRRPLGAARAQRLLAPLAPLLQDVDGLDRVSLVRETIRYRALARGARLAKASRDPVERHTATGLVQMARGQGPAAERSLLRALAIDPGFEGALCALMLLQEDAIASGRSHVSPSPRLREDPAAAVIEGWRRRGAGDGLGVRALEPRLAAIAPRHPLFGAGTRLRVEWRIASGEAPLAAEALDLLEPLLVPPSPEDLLLRARAAVAAHRPLLALGAVNEAMLRGGRPALADEARAILEALAGEGGDEWRQRLLLQLERKVPAPPARAGGSG